MSRLKDKYNDEVVPALIKEFGYTSAMAVPKIKKVANRRRIIILKSLSVT